MGRTMADNQGMRSLCIKYYEYYRCKYLANLEKDPASKNSVKDLEAICVIWTVIIQFGGHSSETLFQGYTLQQLVDAVFGLVDVKQEERQFWDFYLQGNLLSTLIGGPSNLEAAREWALTWEKTHLSVFVNPGEVIHVQLKPRARAPISGAASKQHFESFLSCTTAYCLLALWT